ncbi:uncharacterized protein LOC117091397, partial [Trachypithecus francoisi]|uniref:uncharacterized protein LOC117091397 n=1 Tax=Trachypithecus francoisi TaxID=54180 RepID=UPI00141BF072
MDWEVILLEDIQPDQEASRPRRNRGYTARGRTEQRPEPSLCLGVASFLREEPGKDTSLFCDVGLLLSCRTTSSRAAFVRGCSVFVLLNAKRRHGLGMRLQLLREPGIFSRGRGLHKAKVEPPQKRLTSGHMTQAQTRREARQRQADMQEIAFRHKGHFPPHTHHTHTHTHTHTQTTSSRAAFVRGCSVFVLLNAKRRHGLGMRLQLLREPGIFSRGRGLHKAKVEPPQKR